MALTGTANADSIVGTDGNDVIDGLDGNDTIAGMGGADAIRGSGGNDSISGGGGMDWLCGGPGNDTLDGGDGAPYGDTASYADSPAGINVDLSTGVAADGWGGTDTLISIENIEGSPYADFVQGDGGPNAFQPGPGDDTFLGGGGIDRVNYMGVNSGVTVNLLTQTATGASIGTDTFNSVEAVHGSFFADTLTLSNAAGGYAFGRAGADLMVGGTSDDTFTPGSGADTISGGAGIDFLSYIDDGADGGPAATGHGVNVNLATGTATDNWGQQDTFSGIEGVLGSSHGDVLTGGNPANGSGATDGYEGFYGEGGNDTIDGGAGLDVAYYSDSPSAVQVTLGGTANGTASDGFGGTDTLISIEQVRGSSFNDTLTGSDSGVLEIFEGRAGNDTIDGRGGVDKVTYQSSPAGVAVNLATGTASDGWGGTDTLANIENVRGSESGDTLTGDAGPNDLDGRGGNDLLVGGAGADVLHGGTGDDTLDGGANSNPGDTSNASAEFDVAYYGEATSGMTISLGADGTAGNATGGGLGNDVLIDIEYVIGSNYSDVISGSDRAMREIIRGGPGDDTLSGGTGTGTDLGFNFVDYRTASGSVTVDLAQGRASGADGNDVLSGFRGVFGSDYADQLTGSAAGDFLRGGGGNDTIDGGAGNDLADYSKASGAVTVDLSLGTSSGADGQDTLVSIESVRGSDYGDTLAGDGGANNLQGRAGDDTMSGGAGNDTLSGGYGNDQIDGGSGIDTAWYEGTRSQYSASGSLAQLTLNGEAAGEGIDQLVGIERLHFADVNVALDVAGAAGMVARIIGAVFGAAAINPNYVGIGLGYMDAGMAYQDLMQLALGARLGNAATNADVVQLLYTNVVGVAPPAGDLAYFTNLLDGGMSRGAVGAMAADTDLNANNIHLAGLAQTGIEYV